jgi:hypothetical protein
MCFFYYVRSFQDNELVLQGFTHHILDEKVKHDLLIRK